MKQYSAHSLNAGASRYSMSVVQTDCGIGHDGLLCRVCALSCGCVLFLAVCVFLLPLTSRGEEEFAGGFDEILESRKSPSEQRQEVLAEQKRVFMQLARERLADIRKSINEGELDNAEQQLIELSKLEEFKAEVDELMALCKKLHGMEKDVSVRKETEMKLIQRSENSLKLPEHFDKQGKSNNVDRWERLDPIVQRLTRKISLRVDAMTLGELITLIHSSESGERRLNITLGDDSLRDMTFSCDLQNVPIYKAIKYLCQKLGISYILKDNILHFQPLPKSLDGQVLETRFITLKYGLIPRLDDKDEKAVVGSDSSDDGKSAQPNTSQSTMIGASIKDNDMHDVELESALKDFFKNHSNTGGYYEFFPIRNLLMLTDTPSNLDLLERLIEALDRPPFQVSIEAKFITVSMSDIMDLGINGRIDEETSQKEGSSDSNNNVKVHSMQWWLPNEFSLQENLGSLIVGGVIGNRTLSWTIEALQQKNSTTILSAPHVTVLNNHTAHFRKGSTSYYFDSYSLASVDNGDKGKESFLVPQGKPTALHLGITLDVKVNIGDNGKTVSLGLRPVNNKFAEWEEIFVYEERKMNVSLPNVRVQSLDTTVSIRSGETVVLGGMMENEIVEKVTGIPYLSDIPLLGWLFKVRNSKEEPTILLLFVTATVINDQGEYVIASSENDIKEVERDTFRKGNP